MCEKKDAQMPIFEPAKDAHAIIEMVLFCQFEPEIDKASISRLSELENDSDLNDERTKFQEIQGHEFQFGRPEEGMRSFQISPIGIDMQKVKAASGAEWNLRTNPHLVSVHCLDYTGWKTASVIARGILRKALDKIGTMESALSAIGLKYVDRFTYFGRDDEYDPNLLFRQESLHLHKNAFESKMRWHCHTGWFEPLDNFVGLECLNQVNIDAAFLTQGGARRPMITIDHNAVVRGTNVEDLAKSLGEDDETLSTITDLLHTKNRHILNDLLTNEMAKRINLG